MVAIAFPPRPTMRAVSTALFPPKEAGVEEDTFIRDRKGADVYFLKAFFFSFFKKDYLFIYREGREKERERNINVRERH